MRNRLLPTWEQLSLKQQVAQLLVVRASGHLFDHQIRYPQWEPPTATLKHLIQDLGVGSIIFLGGSASDLAVRTQQLQDWSQIPLLMAADIEEGVGQRFAGAIGLPPPMALGEIAHRHLQQACDYARQLGQVTAQEAQAIGLNWLLAPVVDVNNNPLNPAINLRSFGETPETVSALIAAFIQGTQSYPVLTTAKHFPGHGDTAVDSHLELPLIPHDRERLERVELAPFRAAIAAGVSAVMTAHLRVPALDPDRPATLSPLVLTQLLRQEMEFAGLIVTDALVMQAITRHYGSYEAPVMALEAGADVVLMPVDPAGTIAAIYEAVQTGRLSLERLHRSLERIWQAKQQVFPAVASSPDPETASIQYVNQLAQPTAIDLCQTIVQQSLQIQTAIPPVSSSSKPSQPPAAIGLPTNLILVDNLLEADFLGMHTPAIKLPQQWGYRLQWVDNQTPVVGAIALQPTLLQLFIRGKPFQDNATLLQTAQHWLKTLLSAEQLQALILYGSPYVWEPLRTLLPAEVPAVFSYAQLPIAQTIALEKLLTLGLTLQSPQHSDQRFTT